jgi:hypothetical protein
VLRIQSRLDTDASACWSPTTTRSSTIHEKIVPIVSARASGPNVRRAPGGARSSLR